MQTPDTHVLEDLEQQFENNLTEIKNCYASFTCHLCKSIQDKGVSVDKFRSYLLTLSAFKDKPQCRVLSNIQDKLENAKTIEKIFSYVTEWATFLDDDIFQLIVEVYKIDCRSIDYSMHLWNYLRKHKISDFAKINPKLRDVEDCSVLTLKMNIERVRDITNVIDLKRKVATILGMRASALRLMDIQEGCILVTFLVPALVPDVLFGDGRELTITQLKQLQDLSIQWMKCGEHMIKIRKDSTSHLHEASEDDTAITNGGTSKEKEEYEDELVSTLLGKTYSYYCTLQISAAKEGNLGSVQALLRIGIDPNVQEKDEVIEIVHPYHKLAVSILQYGWTPLLWACERGHSEVVDYLLEHGAEVDIKDVGFVVLVTALY